MVSTYLFIDPFFVYEIKVEEPVEVYGNVCVSIMYMCMYPLSLSIYMCVCICVCCMYFCLL